VALAGAVALLLGAIFGQRTTVKETGKRISWSIFGFIAGMIIVVRSVEDTGLTTAFSTWLLPLFGHQRRRSNGRNGGRRTGNKPD
jgi:arsenical pump membrane protein